MLKYFLLPSLLIHLALLGWLGALSAPPTSIALVRVRAVLPAGFKISAAPPQGREKIGSASNLKPVLKVRKSALIHSYRKEAGIAPAGNEGENRRLSPASPFNRPALGGGVQGVYLAAGSKNRGGVGNNPPAGQNGRIISGSTGGSKRESSATVQSGINGSRPAGGNGGSGQGGRSSGEAGGGLENAAPGGSPDLAPTAPVPLEAPLPAYPASARQAERSGKVALLIRVGEKGEVEEAQIRQSSGDAQLDASALQAVKNWRFSPARRGGKAVSAQVSLKVGYQLSEE